jgi:putative tricarboxylic transport membrane protein
MRVKRFLPAIPLALAIVYLYFTEQIRETGLGTQIGAKVFPRLLSIALVIGALLWFIEINREANRPELSSQTVLPEEGWRTFRVLAAVIVWTFFYYLAFQWLGYLLATTVYLLPLMIYFNRGRWVANVLTSVLYTLGSYYLFSHILGVAIPKGLILAF